VVVVADLTQLLKMVLPADLVEVVLGDRELVDQRLEAHQVLQILLLQIMVGVLLVAIHFLVPPVQIREEEAVVVLVVLVLMLLIPVLVVMVVMVSHSQFLELL